ncbi:MAG: hypothetical protein ABWX56_04665 [Mycetocola sp.]
MGRRVAAPRTDTRPLLLRVAIMLLGIVVLVVGTLAAILLVATFLFGGGDLFPQDGGSWDVSAGGAILGMATTCGVGAFVGWMIFLNGRYGPNKGNRQGKHRPAGRDGSGGDGGVHSDDSDSGAGDSGGGGDGGGGGGD